MILSVALLACAPEVLEISAERDASGLDVKATLPVERLELRDASGALVVGRTLDPPDSAATIRAPLTPGQYELRAVGGGQSVLQAVVVTDPGPVSVRIEAPQGQDSQGRSAVLQTFPGSTRRAALVVTATSDTDVVVVVGDRTERWNLVSGERRVLAFEVGDEEVNGEVRVGPQRLPFSISPTPANPSQVVVREIAVPALADGRRDITAPSRIQLPAPWWDALLDRFSLGFRARDDLAPRTHVAAAVHNPSDRPTNVVLGLTVRDEQGPSAAFRPRLREASGLQTVRRLVRIPPGETVWAALPLYLDRSVVPGGLVVEVVVTARPVGAALDASTLSVPLVVHRGTGWATGLLVLGALGALIGWIGVGIGLPRWLRWGTRDLTTVAVFGCLGFTVGAASQVLGMGVASVLGPFAPFVLGLADDGLRLCLLGALLSVVPRPGAFALATLVGWLMRALALGAVHPVDALYLGLTILWTEALLWICGITSSNWTRDRPMTQWLRLVGGLAVPNALGTAMALAVSVVLYRLYYADWYVLSLVALPGFVYGAFGCALAVPFAASLRRVG